jgi:hypothetical protein
MDPHYHNLNPNNVPDGIFDRLGGSMRATIPTLRSQSPETGGPHHVEFKLRDGVKLHDGTPSPPMTSCSPRPHPTGARTARQAQLCGQTDQTA